MGIREGLDETTRQWLDSIGIRAVEVVDKSWPDSDSRVSRVVSDDGRTFFVKRFESSAKYVQEAHAYQNWLGELDSFVPRVMSTNSQELILLLTDVGDCCCDWQELTPAQRSSLLRQAGRFLRTLHDIPFADEDPMALGDAVLTRAHALQRRIGEAKVGFEYLSPNTMSGIVDNIGEVLTLLNQTKRVPCHRDFWRRNWIWRESTGGTREDVRLGVIDFEHSRSDLLVFDFLKLWSDCWLANPDLEEPFWDGYGRLLSADERTLLRRCAAIHAVQTIVWGVEHQNMEFTAQGKQLLAAAMDEGEKG